MKKKYASPAVWFINVSSVTYLMETSFPGQHNPGDHGTGPSEEENEAKQSFYEDINFWEE